MDGDVLGTDQCDVEDANALQDYRSKRAEWIGWLSADSENDIWTQLSRMTWNDAVFRLINEARRLTADSGQRCSIHNRMLDGFAVEGYLAIQLLTVRRLTDRRRNTISLYRLVHDVKRSRRLITRENYVSFDGVPYDYGPAQQEAMNQALHRADDEDIEHLPSPALSSWIKSATRHKMFDRISNKDAPNRCRTDLIDDIVLERFHSMVGRECYGELLEIADNFLAHAGGPYMRTRSRKDIKITLDLIADAHHKLLTACHILSTAILNYADRNWLPVAQYNIFENLDKPWAPSDNLKGLHKWWKEHERKLSCWRQHALDEVLSSDVS